jgi:hypothetical protein
MDQQDTATQRKAANEGSPLQMMSEGRQQEMEFGNDVSDDEANANPYQGSKKQG